MSSQHGLLPGSSLPVTGVSHSGGTPSNEARVVHTAGWLGRSTEDRRASRPAEGIRYGDALGRRGNAEIGVGAGQDVGAHEEGGGKVDGVVAA